MRLIAVAGITACGGGSDGVAGNVLPDNRVSEIRIAPGSASLALGDSLDLTATAYGPSGNAVGQPSFTWSSSATLVASVSALGRVTAIAAGTATISASSAGVTGTATITVTVDSVVANVAISPSTATVQVGAVVALGAVARSAAGQTLAGKTFAWASSDPATAAVSAAGAVTGVAVGTATITASTAGKSAAAVIIVSAVAADSVVASVSISPSSTTVQVGTSALLGAVAKNAAGQTLGGKTFTWTSSAPAIASVSAPGIVTGIALGGPVTVTAATAGKSAAASITVAPFPTSTGTITVDGAQRFQTMKGWEALSGMGHAECERQAQVTYVPEVIDRAANGVGINRLKLPLRPSYEQTSDWFLQFEAGLITFDQWKLVQSIPLNDNNDPFVINPAGFQWGHLDYGIESLLLPLKKQLQARGDDLWFSLGPNGPRTATLYRDYPEEYAEFVLAAFQHLQQKYGLVPNSLEIMNEPDAAWNAYEVGHLAVAAKKRLNAHGFFPEFIAPSGSSITSTIQYFDLITPIPGVTQTLTDIAYHRYGGVGPTVSQLQGIAQRGAQYGMSTAMTEHGGSGYQALHEDLTIANVSAWEQFGMAFCNTLDNGGKYFGVAGAAIGQNSPSVITLQKTQFLRQYFRYVALRAVRVGATTADARFAPVAFRNANGKYVVVVNASAGGSFTVGGLPAGTYGIDYTTANEYMRPLSDVTITSSQALTTAIPTTGVLTIFAK